MKKYIPILSWLPAYKKSWLSSDLTAGLTVGVMLIPQGMAYALLAGMPPIYGLYASLVPLLIYTLFGTSRQLAVGPVALVALLVASGLAPFAEQGTMAFITLALLLAFMVGAIQFLMGVLKMGFLVNFLSHPVIAGFTSAAALVIGFSQLKHLLGLDIPRGKIYETLLSVFQNLDAINSTTLMIGLVTIAMILILKRMSKKIPGLLLVVILATIASYFFSWNNHGVQIVGEVPSGLPKFQGLDVNGENLISLLPISLTIAFIGFMESFAVAKALQQKHKNYNIEPNQELMAIGLANMGASFFGSFPIAGGFGRTAVNNEAGAKTGLAALISAIVVLFVLMFMTEYFYYLPKAVLAAIIMIAVIGLIDFKEAKHLLKKDKLDFVAFAITALATLIIGVEEGIAFGVAFSLLLLIYRVSYPHVAIMGKVPNSNVFRNKERFSKLQSTDDFLILRFDALLFFGNCEFFKQTILKGVNANEKIRKVLIEASGIQHIDSSSVHMLKDLNQELKNRKITLMFSDVKGPLRDIFKRNELFEFIGETNFFLSSEKAYNAENKEKKEVETDYLFQTKS